LASGSSCGNAAASPGKAPPPTLELAKREAAVAAQEIISQAEGEIRDREAELNRDFDRRKIEIELMLREIRSHEESLGLLDHQLEQRQERLARETAAIKQARDAMRDLSRSLRKRLEGVAALDGEESPPALREEVVLRVPGGTAGPAQGVAGKIRAGSRARGQRILVATMQRLASKPNNDLTATIVQLPNEEMKGRIIGREGRNIKSFEAATGTTLLIDESPQMVLISSFDPVRREVAKLALEGLVKDGRIHPASIEEFVKPRAAETWSCTSRRSARRPWRLNINGLHPEIIKLLGKL
jgi:ribonuclease Y